MTVSLLDVTGRHVVVVGQQKGISVGQDVRFCVASHCTLRRCRAKGKSNVCGTMDRAAEGLMRTRKLDAKRDMYFMFCKFQLRVGREIDVPSTVSVSRERKASSAEDMQYKEEEQGHGTKER